MAIYLFSGAKEAGKSTLAARIVGKSNVYDLASTRRSNPLKYPDAVKKMLDARSCRESRIGIDGICDLMEVQMIRQFAKGEEILHYHIARDGQTYEPTKGLEECAIAADYAVSWSFRPV